MSRVNQFLQRIDEGTLPVGSFLQSGDMFSARAAGDSDLDFVLVDMEHDGFNFALFSDTLQWLISPRRARRTAGASSHPSPLVRLPANAAELPEWMIKQSLDCGAHGILIPWLQHPEDADRIIRAARYSHGPGGPEPRGQRGTCSFNPALRYWGCATFDDYVEAAEIWPLTPRGEVLLMFMIEDPVGIENIEELVQVPGVGAILFGRGDAGQMLGSRGRVLQEAQERVLEVCKKAGVLVGNVGKLDHEVSALAEQGYDFVVRDTFAPSGRPTRATTRT